MSHWVQPQRPFRKRLRAIPVARQGHPLRDRGRRQLDLGGGEGEKLQPLTEPGSGEVQDPQKALLSVIIAKLNDLFQGVTDDDQLQYVNGNVKGKLLQSDVLAEQAANNTKEQFANSPDLAAALMNAIMDADAAFSSLSKQALDSERIRQGIMDILLNHAGLYEALRQRGTRTGGNPADSRPGNA